MKKTTVLIEGRDLSTLTGTMEGRLKGYYEYFYNDTFIFVNEDRSSRANEALMSVIIVFLMGNGQGEIDVISGGGPEIAEDCSHRQVIQMLRDICASNRWTLVEDGA